MPTEPYAEFFDEQNDELYDEILKDLVPGLEHIDAAFITVLRAAIPIDRPAAILDVGAGTGRNSLLAAEHCPETTRIVSMDCSAAMLNGFRRKLRAAANVTRAHRFKLLEDDFLAPQDSMLTDAAQFDAVLSFFTFHHFTHEQKQSAFQRAYTLLKPGGIIINGDLFSFENPTLSKYALEYDLAFIAKNMEQRIGKVSGAAEEKQQLENLRHEWLDHYRTMNRTEPIDGASGQQAMLTNIGFERVCCPVRLWQAGVLVAYKPAG